MARKSQKTSGIWDKDQRQPNQTIGDNKSAHAWLGPCNKSNDSPDASQSDEEDVDDDDDDEEDDDDDSSAVSTVIQWDSWSLPKDNNATNPPEQNKALPSNITVPAKSDGVDANGEETASPQMRGSNIETDYINSEDERNAESLGSIDTETWKDEEDDRYDESESEAEWSGNLEKAQPDIEDLIEQTKAIDILDSSDDEMVERPQTVGKRQQASREFKRARDDIANDMFRTFDHAFCDGRLADTTTVTWSKTLNTTAGITRMKQSRQTGMRYAEIELAIKVLDNEERLRQTLVHEICHAAAFVIDGVSKPPHGDCFKKWANRAMDRIPGVIVTTKHDYEIKYSHFWTCSDCGLIYKRHSKSIDVKRHRCGRCKGDLFVSTEDGMPKKARAASKYQIFVRENSAAVRASLKQRHGSVPQAEVLQECARLWREQKETEIS